MRLIRRSRRGSRAGARPRSRPRSARRSSRSAPDSAPAGALADRVGERRTRSAAPTCRSRPCRTSSRRSSCSPATCARPSATSSTAPSGRCCARRRAGREAPRRSRCSRATARSAGRAPTCASGSRSPRSGWTSALDADAARARAAPRDPPGHRPRRPAAAGRAQRQGAGGARRGVLALRRAHPAHVRLRGGARLGHRARRHRGAAATRTSARSRAMLRHGVEDRPHRPAAARVRPRRGSPRRSIRPPTWTSTSSACRRSTTATCSSTRPARRRAGSRRRSCSGCASRWASASRSPRATARRACSTSTRSTGSAATARRRRRCSTPARCTRSSRPAIVYTIEDTLSSIVGRGIAENAMCSKWAGGLGGSWTAVRGTGSHIESHQRREPGRRPVPEAAQRPARRRQPGRQARGRRLRLPRGLAQRHPRVPRAAPQHRRRAPPHARHEHRVLDPGPVHEARRGARAAGRCSARTTCPTCTRPTARRSRSATRPTRRASPRASCTARRCPALELWKQMLKMLFETGHPWLTFKDPCNVRSPQDHAGVIHSSNLCTEITLNTGAGRDRGLQLGSIVLDQHLTPPASSTTPSCARRSAIAVRALDNVIDVNFYPTEPTRDGQRPPPARGPRRHGPAVRAVSQAPRVRLRGGARVHRRGDGGDRLLRLRGVQRPRRRARHATAPTPARSGTAGCSRQDTLELLEAERGEASTSRAAACWTGLRCGRRSPRRGCATPTCWRSRRRRRSPTSWARRPASSRSTRTCSPSRTCPATSSC